MIHSRQKLIQQFYYRQDQEELSQGEISINFNSRNNSSCLHFILLIPGIVLPGFSSSTKVKVMTKKHRFFNAGL